MLQTLFCAALNSSSGCNSCSRRNLRNSFQATHKLSRLQTLHYRLSCYNLADTKQLLRGDAKGWLSICSLSPDGRGEGKEFTG